MDSVSLLNGILLVASIIALHLISGKTNRERRWGFWITVGTQPLFFYLGMVTAAWILMPLSSYRLYQSYRGIKNNPAGFDKHKK